LKRNKNIFYNELIFDQRKQKLYHLSQIKKVRKYKKDNKNSKAKLFPTKCLPSFFFVISISYYLNHTNLGQELIAKEENRRNRN